jgi:hypothetical protein
MKLDVELKKRQEALIEELEKIGEFRQGSFNEIYRKCGKTNCACSQPDHPGHGPQYTLTCKVEKKTKIQNLTSDSAIEIVKEQIANRNRFGEWLKKWRQLNEEISDVRLNKVSSREATEKTEVEKKLRRISKRRSRKKSRS